MGTPNVSDRAKYTEEMAQHVAMLFYPYPAEMRAAIRRRVQEILRCGDPPCETCAVKREDIEKVWTREEIRTIVAQAKVYVLGNERQDAETLVRHTKDSILNGFGIS